MLKRTIRYAMVAWMMSDEIRWAYNKVREVIQPKANNSNY
jgi:hypothetical protein